MANWSVLKAAIANVIKTNGNQEITGALLQNTLTSIVTSVGENATFAGIATPTTNPGIPDGPVFYLANITGTYPNFNNISILYKEIAILHYTGSSWKKQPFLNPNIINNTSININDLVKEPAKTFTLSEAISLVPEELRYYGLVIYFRDSQNDRKYTSAIFTVTSYDNADVWNNLQNWQIIYKYGELEEARKSSNNAFICLPSIINRNADSIKENNKNLFSVNDVFYGFIDSYSLYGYQEKFKHYRYAAIECKPETHYTLSGLFISSKKIGVADKNFNVLDYVGNKDGLYIKIDGGNWEQPRDIHIYTVNKNAKYIIFNVATNESIDFYLKGNIQLEEGETATSYVKGLPRYLGFCEAKDFNSLNERIANISNIYEYKLQESDYVGNYLIKYDGIKEGNERYSTAFYNVYPKRKCKVVLTNTFSSEDYSIISLWGQGDKYIGSKLNSPLLSGDLPKVVEFEIPKEVTKIGVYNSGQHVYLEDIFDLKSFKDNLPSNVHPTMRCLFIGNSVNQDAASCIPYLLNKLYGNSIQFEIAIAYIGSYTIKDYVDLVIPGNTNVEIYSYAKNTKVWTNRNGVSLNTIIKDHNWNLVTFQMYKTSISSGREEDISKAPQLFDYIKNNVPTGCKVGLVTPATFSDIRSKYIEWQQTILKSCALDFMIDYGATKEFMIKSGFNESELSDDDIHSNDGFPCIAIALTAIHFLAQIYKLEDKASTFKEYIDNEEWTSLNIPGSNGHFTTTTHEKWKKAVNCAINGYRVSCSSYNKSNDSLNESIKPS